MIHQHPHLSHSVVAPFKRPPDLNAKPPSQGEINWPILRWYFYVFYRPQSPEMQRRRKSVKALLYLKYSFKEQTTKPVKTKSARNNLKWYLLDQRPTFCTGDELLRAWPDWRACTGQEGMAAGETGERRVRWLSCQTHQRGDTVTRYFRVTRDKRRVKNNTHDLTLPSEAIITITKLSNCNRDIIVVFSFVQM